MEPNRQSNSDNYAAKSPRQNVFIREQKIPNHSVLGAYIASHSHDCARKLENIGALDYSIEVWGWSGRCGRRSLLPAMPPRGPEVSSVKTEPPFLLFFLVWNDIFSVFWCTFERIPHTSGNGWLLVANYCCALMPRCCSLRRGCGFQSVADLKRRKAVYYSPRDYWPNRLTKMQIMLWINEPRRFLRRLGRETDSKQLRASSK